MGSLCGRFFGAYFGIDRESVPPFIYVYLAYLSAYFFVIVVCFQRKVDRN